MNSRDILLIGIRNRVVALAASSGQTLWSTELPHALMGAGFVTVLAAGDKVFAYGNGQAYGLDLASGRLLWANPLPGCGYGYATLAVPDGGSAPHPAIVARLVEDQHAAANSSSPAPTH